MAEAVVGTTTTAKEAGASLTMRRAAAAAPEINECLLRVVEEISPLHSSLNRPHVGTLQMHFKKISDARKRFTTKTL